MHSIFSTRIIIQARKAAKDTDDQPIEGVPLSNLNLTTEGSELTKMTTTTTEEIEVKITTTQDVRSEIGSGG